MPSRREGRPWGLPLRGLKVRRVGIRPDAVAGAIQRGKFCEVVVVEGEIEHREVFRDALGVDGFRDHQQTAVEMPADDRLCGGFAMFGGDFLYGGICEQLSLPERIP